MTPLRAVGSALLLALGACGGDGGATPSPTPSGDGSCSAGAPVAGTPPLTTTRIANGLDNPLDVQAPSARGQP